MSNQNQEPKTADRITAQLFTQEKQQLAHIQLGVYLKDHVLNVNH